MHKILLRLSNENLFDCVFENFKVIHFKIIFVEYIKEKNKKQKNK